MTSGFNWLPKNNEYNNNMFTKCIKLQTTTVARSDASICGKCTWAIFGLPPFSLMNKNTIGVYPTFR